MSSVTCNQAQGQRMVLCLQAERKPVAAANCALSERNWLEAVGVPSQLGLDPRAAAALDTAVRSGES